MLLDNSVLQLIKMSEETKKWSLFSYDPSYPDLCVQEAGLLNQGHLMHL